MEIKTSRIAAYTMLFLIITLVSYDYLTHTYIKAEFKKTDPMPVKMGVFFKGYRLGNTTKLKISKDFKTTYLYITLNQRGLHLPRNIEAEVKNYNEDTKFIDIIYPTAPEIKYLKSGDVIKGRSNLQGTNGLSNTNQAHIDNLSEKGESLLNSAKQATDTLTNLFGLIYDILSENRQNLLSSSTSLKNSMDNLEQTSNNLKDISTKLNNEINEQFLSQTVEDISKTTENIANGTKDLKNITGNFNKTSADFTTLAPKLHELIAVGKTALCNLNRILLGLGETLKKRAGGMRVLFGVPIKE